MASCTRVVVGSLAVIPAAVTALSVNPIPAVPIIPAREMKQYKGAKVSLIEMETPMRSCIQHYGILEPEGATSSVFFSAPPQLTESQCFDQLGDQVVATEWWQYGDGPLGICMVFDLSAPFPEHFSAKDIRNHCGSPASQQDTLTLVSDKLKTLGLDLGAGSVLNAITVAYYDSYPQGEHLTCTQEGMSFCSLRNTCVCGNSHSSDWKNVCEGGKDYKLQCTTKKDGDKTLKQEFCEYTRSCLTTQICDDKGCEDQPVQCVELQHTCPKNP